jgi:hypothetical protein
MSFESGDVFLSPEHPGPNCYHPLSVREPVRARYIADLNRRAPVLERFPEIDANLRIGEVDRDPSAMEPSTPSDLHRG